jgi:hypothetical protein
MAKLILMSVVFATTLIPAACARDVAPRRGLKRAVLGMLAFNLVFALLVIFVYPRLDQ